MEDFDLRRCVDYMMEKRWKDYRYKLHQYYKKFKSTEEARQHPYGNITQDDWDWLCTLFEDKYLQKRPKKDPVSRAQLPYNHRAWSQSIFSYVDHEAELFHDTHSQTEALRVEMEELRGLVQNQQVEVETLRNIIQDQQDRLRRLEERVFTTDEGAGAAIDQNWQGTIVVGQEERLRLLEEQVYVTSNGDASGSRPSNKPGLG